MKKYINFLTTMGLLFLFVLGLHVTCNGQGSSVVSKIKPIKISKLDSLTKAITVKSDSIQLLAKKLRIVESNLTRAKTQLTTKNKQVNGLKADTAKLNKDIVLKDAMYNECLDSYMQSIGYLQDISFILGDKKRPRKKLILIGQIINQASHTE